MPSARSRSALIVHSISAERLGFARSISIRSGLGVPNRGICPREHRDMPRSTMLSRRIRPVPLPNDVYSLLAGMSSSSFLEKSERPVHYTRLPISIHLVAAPHCPAPPPPAAIFVMSSRLSLRCAMARRARTYVKGGGILPVGTVKGKYPPRRYGRLSRSRRSTQARAWPVSPGSTHRGGRKKLSFAQLLNVRI